MSFSGQRKVRITMRGLPLTGHMLRIRVEMKSAITVTEPVTLQKTVEALEDDIQDQDREVRAEIETTEAEIAQILETEIDETIETDHQLDIEIEVQEEMIEEEMTHQEETIGTTVIIVHQLGDDQMKETIEVSPALFLNILI